MHGGQAGHGAIDGVVRSDDPAQEFGHGQAEESLAAAHWAARGRACAVCH
ncbi:hypothetical protein [Streptomyces sp. NBC_00654]|nr:hypothetical protein [Streptomyces sp. NBC_00654]